MVYKRVLVPFKTKKQVGLVLAICPPKEFDYSLKEVHEVIDLYPQISEEQLKLAKWISYFYLCSLGEALGLFVSFGRKKSTKKEVALDAFRLGKRDQVKKEIILENEQNEIFSKIKAGLTFFNYHLIFGVTGSGKTMVYLKLVQEVLNKKRQALILLPEVALVIQVYQILVDFFHEDEVVIFHGKVSEKKKEMAKLKIMRIKPLVVLGTRSAFFLPFRDLGIIVLDEEHDSSYKNNHTPRYQLKTLAHYHAKKKNIPLLTLSATPTIESLYYAKEKKINLFFLKNRYNQKELPKIKFFQTWENKEIADQVNKRIFHKLEKKQQVIIYLNQRGYANSLVCKDCREIFKCPNCAVSLTYHKKINKLICHYCFHYVFF